MAITDHYRTGDKHFDIKNVNKIHTVVSLDTVKNGIFFMIKEQ